jgi:hypothetical protein
MEYLEMTIPSQGTWQSIKCASIKLLAICLTVPFMRLLTYQLQRLYGSRRELNQGVEHESRDTKRLMTRRVTPIRDSNDTHAGCFRGQNPIPGVFNRHAGHGYDAELSRGLHINIRLRLPVRHFLG